MYNLCCTLYMLWASTHHFANMLINKIMINGSMFIYVWWYLHIKVSFIYFTHHIISVVSALMLHYIWTLSSSPIKSRLCLPILNCFELRWIVWRVQIFFKQYPSVRRWRGHEFMYKYKLGPDLDLSNNTNKHWTHTTQILCII